MSAIFVVGSTTDDLAGGSRLLRGQKNQIGFMLGYDVSWLPIR